MPKNTKRPAPSKLRPKKKPERARPRFRIFRKLFLFSLLCLALLALAYLYVDQKVDRNLKSRGEDRVSAILSEPLMLFTGTKMKEASLRIQLQKRQYLEVSGDPTSPGEFSVANGTFTIFNHEFTLPNGSVRSPQKIRYNFSSGAIQNLDDSKGKDLVLEPLIIAPLGGEDLKVSSYRRLDDLPDFIPKAFIAIEDRRFYEHFGIDFVGIGRAIVENIQALRIVQGGSTITQQLAKNLLFSSQKTILRKALEALAAISIERRLTKKQILELYLNEVYFGRDGSIAVHGLAEAASTFLGKKVEDLNLSEAALLAGLVKAPSFYAPRKHLPRAVERRDVVLDSMLEAGFISEADLKKAKATQIKPATETQHRRVAPHFVTTLEGSLEDRFDVDTAIASGLKIYTGLDREMQTCAEDAVTNGIEKMEATYKSLRRDKVKLEGALVALEPYSGLVKAWVGGRDYSENQFNHVSQAERQIGSTIKAFVYLTALDGSLNHYKIATPISILSDEPMKVQLETKHIWVPENYDKEFHGDVTLRYALERSLNIPAAYVGQKVGIDNVANTALKFRLAEKIPRVPSLALGAADTTLLQLTAAYGALANGGIYVAPRLYSSAISGDGEIALSNPVFEERVADEAPVFVLTNLLQGVIERGTARGVRSLGYTRNAAGKTGTSSDARDAWFVGFTPNLVAGVWVGFDDDSKVGLTGGAAAVPIWTEFMKCIQPYHEDLPFLPPRDVAYVDVDMESREVALPDCPRENVIREVFVRGTEPTTPCSLHGGSEEPAETRNRTWAEDSDANNPSLAEEIELESRQRKKSSGGFWESIFGR